MFQDRTPRTVTPLPSALVGRWERTLSNGRPQLIELTSDGFWREFSAFLPLSFQDGGNTMILGPEGHTRQLGSGETVVGTWIEDSTGVDKYFRPNGTFTISEPGEVDLFGIYEISGATMRTGEVRATLSVDSGDLVIDVVYGGVLRLQFTVAGDTLSIVDGEAPFTRVAAATAPSDPESSVSPC